MAIDPEQAAVMRDYVMIVGDSYFYLVGPFDEPDAGATWARGAKLARVLADDARWQSLKLAKPSGMIEIKTPRSMTP